MTRFETAACTAPRYHRATDFKEGLRGAWAQPSFSYQGKYFQANSLQLEPRPDGALQIFQGGQSYATIHMAANHTDWMFLNGGSTDRIGEVIAKVRSACASSGRTVRFAMYAAPLCRPTDAEAWAEIDARLASINQDLGIDMLHLDISDPLFQAEVLLQIIRL